MKNPFKSFWNWLTGVKSSSPPSEAQKSAARYLAQKLKDDSERKFAEIAARQGAKQGARQGLALLPSVPAIIAGLLVVLAIGAGVYMYTNWGKPESEPIQFGPAIDKPRGERVSEPGPGTGSDPYAVFLITNLAGGSIWVGQESTLKSKPLCQFRGGGLCKNDGSDPLVQYEKKSAAFGSFGEAKQTYCRDLKSPPRPMPLTGGSKANIYGGDYWVDTAPGCN